MGIASCDAGLPGGGTHAAEHSEALVRISERVGVLIEAAVLDSPTACDGGSRVVWTLQSTAFENGNPIPKRHSGDGDDSSPPLTWTDPPAGTREFALLVDDPDAPGSEPWVHWVLYKLPARQRSLPEGIPPARNLTNVAGALQGKNSWGTIGWRGPSPPRGHGVHHYHVKLFALDAPLPDQGGLDKQALLAAMQGHVLAQTEIVGTYQR